MAQSPASNAVKADISPEALEAGSVEAAHAALVKDKTIQFEHANDIIKPESDPPEWLENLGKFLGEISPLVSFFFWTALAILVALLLYFIVTEVMGVRFFSPKPAKDEVPSVPEWKPDARDARDLLAAADALAAQGQYEEAVHLILLRSIDDIDRKRPMAVRPALTARDIAAIPTLPERARPAFWQIASAVEKSLFAGGRVDKDEFASCREAYAAFALPGGWQE